MKLPISNFTVIVYLFSNHLDKMPIILVFGVSLSLSSLRSTLTHELSTMLSIEAFQMTSSSVYLSNIIDKVCRVHDVGQCMYTVRM